MSRSQRAVHEPGGDSLSCQPATFPYGQCPGRTDSLSSTENNIQAGCLSMPAAEELMKRTNLLLIAGLVAAVSAQAQTPAPQTSAPASQPPSWEAALKSVTEACKGETPKLCPGLSESTALACLQSNIDKVTPACKDAVMKAAKSALNF